MSSFGEKDFDLTCWYLNVRRVAELVGVEAADLRSLATISEVNEQLQKLGVLSHFKDRITTWVRAAKPPTLGELVLAKKLQTNAIFTHYSNYYFKGLSKVGRALDKNSAKVPMAEAYSKLDDLRDGLRVRFDFSYEHLTSASAWHELSGQKEVLIVGLTTDVTDSVIEVTPYVVAYPFVDLFTKSSFIGRRWPWGLETFIEQIDALDRVSDFEGPRSKGELDQLRSVPEEKIKNAFAELLGEATVPNDWAGERSDLFSTRVTLDGRRISTAIAFKGPAKFHPMTVADLGKNGDQIDRLFSEPADLVVLQHCHEITPPVRGMMRAYAQRMGQLKSFCLIDGYDTLRILAAYQKCGIKPFRKRKIPKG